MARYIVNKNADNGGRHEVHREAACNHLPLPQNRVFVGNFDSCGPAKQAAKQIYATADGCAHCCAPCHTG